jgi:muconolactone delta-isomerase
MANRFPLVVDTTAGNQFRELPDGDNLLLTNSSIVNALDIQALGTVTASQLIVDGTVFRNDYNDLQNKPTIPTSILQLGIGDGTNGQFLTTNGAGTISFQNIPVQDPVLGGDLSGTSSAATINPNTIGITEIDVDDGTIGQVLATDGSGNLQFIDMTGGGGGGGASNFLELSGQIGLSQIDDDFITPVKLKDNGQVPTAGQYLTVAAGGDFEYLDIPTTNPQWDDVQNKPAIPATLTDLGIVEGNDGDILKTDGAGNYTFTAFDSIENIEFSGTTIRTVPDNSNISIDPKGNGYLSIIGTNAVILPAGDTAQRTPNVAGAMRLNTQLGIFEGYDGSNWNGLGGVRSVDGLTYVSAESTPGASDDTITFVTNGQTSATLTETKLELNQAVGLKIKSTETALDFETGALSVDGGVSIKGNLIVSGAISVNEEFNTSVKVDGTTLSGSQTNQFSIGASDIDYFATSMKVRLFGASADDIDQDQTNLGVQVSRVGFGTPDGSGNEVTFSYRVAQMDQVSGKISAVTAAADITIEPEEITDFNNNKNIQVVVSRVSSSHNILVYRKVGSEVDYTLHSVLGPKELGVALSNIVFTDYYDFDVTPWSKRTNQGLFTTDSGLVHVPLTAPGSPKLGWFDTEITNINTDTNTLTVANQYYATSNSIEVVVDDTVAVQTAIDAAKAQNRNLLTLENRTYFIKRLELPDGLH